MANYENAPATILLATTCACCGRPLVDAASVEAGIGPDCRRKYGYGDAQAPADWLSAVEALDPRIVPNLFGSARSVTAEWGVDARAVCNVLVNRFALASDLAEKGALVAAVGFLGFTRLATKLAESALGKVEVLPAGDRLAVKTPYRADFVAALKAARIGARWDRETKVWTVPVDQRARAGLWGALRAHFAGALLVSERGTTTVPEAA